METLHINDTTELALVVQTVIAKLVAVHTEGHTPVLALSGELGAGKTTFMQALAETLGVTETVISPTYVIMKRYELSEAHKDMSPFTSLIHMDVYRVDDVAEMEPLRFGEMCTVPKAVVAIEWAERIQSLLPPHTVYMDIKVTGEQTREITFRHHE